MTWRKKDKDRNDENRRNMPYFNFMGEDFFNFNLFEDLERYMENIREAFLNSAKNNEVAYSKMFGPYYYGRITTIGPDGKPVVREYGNIDPRTIGFPVNKMIDRPVEEQQLIDTFIEEKTVKIVMELPGVEKDDLKINATEDKVIIKAMKQGKEISAEKVLTVKIKPETAKASLKNGVLEIIFERKEPGKNNDGFEIKIE